MLEATEGAAKRFLGQAERGGGRGAQAVNLGSNMEYYGLC
jgi:hypothetical protein